MGRTERANQTKNSVPLPFSEMASRLVLDQSFEVRVLEGESILAGYNVYPRGIFGCALPHL